MLAIHAVSKTYGKRQIISSLSHDFRAGVTVITGRSGAGKSTLLRMCASAEKPSSGDILWHDKSIIKKPKLFRSVLGYAPQRIDFPEDISGMDFLCHIGALKNIPRKDAAQQGMALMTRLGLEADANNRIQTYSGGMRRRLGLAQAFLGEPRCMALDEPTAELDPVTAGIVHDLIFETAQTATVLMTTHLAESLQSYTYDTLEIEAAAS